MVAEECDDGYRLRIAIDSTRVRVVVVAAV